MIQISISTLGASEERVEFTLPVFLHVLQTCVGTLSTFHFQPPPLYDHISVDEFTTSAQTKFTQIYLCSRNGLAAHPKLSFACFLVKDISTNNGEYQWVNHYYMMVTETLFFWGDPVNPSNKTKLSTNSAFCRGGGMSSRWKQRDRMCSFMAERSSVRRLVAPPPPDTAESFNWLKRDWG